MKYFIKSPQFINGYIQSTCIFGNYRAFYSQQRPVLPRAGRRCNKIEVCSQVRTEWLVAIWSPIVFFRISIQLQFHHIICNNSKSQCCPDRPFKFILLSWNLNSTSHIMEISVLHFYIQMDLSAVHFILYFGSDSVLGFLRRSCTCTCTCTAIFQVKTSTMIQAYLHTYASYTKQGSAWDLF